MNIKGYSRYLGRVSTLAAHGLEEQRNDGENSAGGGGTCSYGIYALVELTLCDFLQRNSIRNWYNSSTNPYWCLFCDFLLRRLTCYALVELTKGQYFLCFVFIPMKKSYEFNHYFCTWQVNLLYPKYIHTRSGQPSCTEIIEVFGVNHGIQRLWPIPPPVACWHPDQGHQRLPHTMCNATCAWFG